MVNGILTCQNAFVDEKDLEEGFVKAYNTMMADSSRKKHWKKMVKEGTPLQKIRARQLLELSEQNPLTGMVDELAKLVIWEVTILGKREYEFTFMDGSKTKAKLL